MVKQTARVIGGASETQGPPASHNQQLAEALTFGEPDEDPPARVAARFALPAFAWIAVVATLAVLEYGAALLGLSFWLSSKGITLVMQTALPVLAVLALHAMGTRLRVLKDQSDDVRTMMARIVEPEPATSRNIVSIRHAMHKELTALNDHLDRSLNKTGEIEAIIKREVGALEHSFADNERRMLGLVQELARQRETVVTATEQVRDVVKANREALNIELANLASQVLEAGNYARGAVEEVSAELKGELAARGSDFSDMLRQVITDKIEPVNEMLAAQIQSMDALLSDGNGGLVAAFETHGKDVVTKLDAAWGRISTDLSNRSKAAEDVAGRLVGVIEEGLESGVNKLENRIRSASLEIFGVLDSAAEQAAQKIVEVGASSTGDLDVRVEALSARIDGQVQRFGDLLQGAGDRFIPALEAQGHTLERAIRLQDAVEQSTSQLNAVLSHKASEFVDTLSLNLKTFQTQLGERSSIITDELSAKLDRAVDALEDGSRRFSTTLLNVQDTISVASDRLTISAAGYNADFAQRVEQIETILTDGSEKIGDRLSKNTAELATTLADRSLDLEVTLDNWSSHITQIVADGVRQSDTALAAKAEEFRALEITGREQLQSVLDAAAMAIASRLADGTGALADTVVQAKSDMAEATGRLGGDLATLWTKFAGELGDFTARAKTTLVDAGSDNLASLDARMTDLKGALKGQLNAIHSSLDARTRELEANIVQFGSTIDTQTSRLNKVIGQKSEAIEQEIEEGLVSFDRAMTDHLGRARAAIATMTAEETALFARQIETLDHTLDGQSASFGTRVDAIRGLLDARTQAMESQLGQFGAGIEAQTTRLEASIGEKSQVLAQSVAGGAKQIEATLSDHLSRLVGVTEGFVEMETTTFDRQIDVLSRTLDSRSEILDSIMRTRGAEFTDKLHASSRQFEEELAEQGRALDGTVRSASANLRIGLIEQTTEMQRLFSAALEKAHDTTVEQAAGIETRLTDTSRRLTHVLDEQSAALALALDQRTAELNRTLSLGTSDVGSVLDTESTRLAKLLADATSTIEDSLGSRVTAMGAQLREQTATVAAAIDEGSSRISRVMERATGEWERSAQDGARELGANLDKSLEAAALMLATGAESTQQQVAASVESLLARLAAHERSAVNRMEGAAANVGESTRKAAELTAERLVTLNGAVVQVLNSLGSTRAPARRPKLEVLPDAAE